MKYENEREDKKNKIDKVKRLAKCRSMEYFNGLVQ